MSEKPVVAAFDFDGTLTRRDTLLPFLLHTLGAAALARRAFALVPVLAGYGLGRVSNGAAKERVLVRCIGGMRADELQRQAERFAAEVVPGLLRNETMRRLDWHRQRGHRCVVVSASLELYVGPWARRAGFDDIVATRLEAQDATVSGRLFGANCYGAEKVARLERLLGDRNGYRLYAYGDSRGDRELLAYADYAYYREIPGTKEKKWPSCCA